MEELQADDGEWAVTYVEEQRILCNSGGRDRFRVYVGTVWYLDRLAIKMTNQWGLVRVR